MRSSQGGATPPVSNATDKADAMNWDEEPVKKPKPYEIGADLSALSVKELEAYIEVLNAERQRVEAMLVAKQASRNAAHSVFKS
jgi:uncharacterized small protein (DUF1192 family)